MRFYYFNSTHWDREWYLPFERFRIKLIELVLHLLDRLENDPEYGIFTFDGQTVWMEDVEEIRPDLRARLFSVSKMNISLHIARILKDGELDESVVKSFFTTAQELELSERAVDENILSY